MKPLSELSDDEFHQRMRQAVSLRDAPAGLIHAAMALWSAGTPAGPRAALRRLLAVLRADSWAPASGALAMRGGAASTSHHLLFSAEGRDIDLRITAVGSRFALAGQILGPDDSGEVRLAAADHPDVVVALANLDALGEFRIDDLAPGPHVLTLRLGDDEIVLPPLAFGLEAR